MMANLSSFVAELERRRVFGFCSVLVILNVHQNAVVPQYVGVLLKSEDPQGGRPWQDA